MQVSIVSISINDDQISDKDIGDSSKLSSPFNIPTNIIIIIIIINNNNNNNSDYDDDDDMKKKKVTF